MRKHLFYSALLLTLANLLLRAIGMGFQVYLAGQVGAAGIGLMQLVLTVGGMAMTVGTSGVRVAGMYLCAEELGHGRRGGVRSAMACCMGYALVISALTGAALILLSPFIAGRWIGDEAAAPALRLTGAFLPFQCLTAVLGGYFTAAAKVGRLVLVDLAERLASIGLTLLLLGPAENPGDACAAIVAGSALATMLGFFVLLSLYLRDARTFGPRSGPGMLRRMGKLCAPLALNEYLRSGLGTLEHMLIPRGLSRTSGDHQAAMADYGAIHGMVFPILYFPTSVLYALSDLLVPELARCAARNMAQRTEHLTDKCLRLGCFYACLMAGGLYCLSDPLSLRLYPKNAAQVSLYLRLFSPLVLALYLDAIVDGMNKGLGQQVICVRYNTFTSLLDVALLLLLLPRWGIGGYYFSFSLTHLLNFFLSIRRLLLVSGHKLSLALPLKAALCAVFACALALRLTLPGAPLLAELLVRAGAYLILYLGLAQLLRALSGEDLHWLRGIVFPGRKR
ncbi:MAG: polysaccharide biosynthesis C-terminal domain-containing protein [Oscillospiraceae bacterium]|nr:polysaccharide biosynthesis C-terminal domain-containing protein [Oscillospiraceae bacterium]